MVKKPHGFSDAHSMTVQAVRDFVASANFHGVLTPGGFYDFCRSRAVYAEIDRDFRYKWDIDLREICNRLHLPYRPHRPPHSSGRSAKRTAAELVTIARDWNGDEDIQLVEFLAKRLGRTKTVVSASFHRSVGRENLEHLLGCGFDTEALPDLTRDDLKDFFTFIRQNNLTTISEFVAHIRESIGGSAEFDFRESIPEPAPGWVYLFEVQRDNNRVLVKCGRSERHVEERLGEHVLSSMFPVGGWAYVLHSGNVLLDEELLIAYLDERAKRHEGTAECFWVSPKMTFQISGQDSYVH